MSEDTNPILAKREAALAKLRRRRGEPRQPIFSTRVEQERDRLALIVKAYRSLHGEDENDEDPGEALLPPMEHDAAELPVENFVPPDVPVIGEAEVVLPPAELPRVLKARRQADSRASKANEAIEKWRALMKGRRERQMAPGDAPPKPAGLPTEERRQMFFDLLTVDFFENSRIWISANADSLDLSSTTREEIERVHDQAVYRRRVLEELGKMNEQEIDAVTTYLRSLETPEPRQD